MFTYSPMWSYEVGGYTRALMRLAHAGARIADSTFQGALSDAERGLMQAFKDFGPLVSTALPNSSQSVVPLIRAIHQIRQAGGGDIAFNLRTMSPTDAAEFRSLASAFEADLSRDMESWMPMVLQDQGAYRSQSLFAEPPAAFALATWAAMSSEARVEMVHAARCLALECFTASGFHSIRGVECMVRHYLVKVNGALPRKRDWGEYVAELKKCNAAERVSAIIDDLRKHDRNPLMHPDLSFGLADEAIDLLNLCKTALNRIVADLSARGIARPSSEVMS